MVPYWQPSGQAMVDLKLWFQSDLLKVLRHERFKTSEYLRVRVTKVLTINITKILCQIYFFQYYFQYFLK